MPKASQLDTHFSPVEQGKLAAFLNANPALTVDAFADMLADKGLEVARSTAHEYQRKLTQMGAAMKQSRMVSEALSRDLGDAAVEGEFGRVLIEIVRTLAFNASMAGLEEGAEGFDPQNIAFLAKAQKDLAHAARLAQDFEMKVDEVRKNLANDHAQKLEGALKDAEAEGERGLSAERVAQLRRDFLGVRE